MLIEISPGKRFKYRIIWTKIDHVHRTDRNHLWYAILSCRIQAMWTGIQDATHQFICPFSCGEIKDTCKISGRNKVFHRLSTNTCSMEDKHLISAFFEI